jgi:hypothetical protein
LSDQERSSLPAEVRRQLERGQKAMDRMARDGFVAGDAEAMLCCHSNELGLGIVADNIDALNERGIYEQALVSRPSNSFT